MDGAKEDLIDMFIVHTTEEIQVRCLSEKQQPLNVELCFD